MIDPDRLSPTKMLEVLLGTLHEGWMKLDVIWLEALAMLLLTAVIVPLLLNLFDRPATTSFLPRCSPPSESDASGRILK